MSDTTQVDLDGLSQRGLHHSEHSANLASKTQELTATAQSFTNRGSRFAKEFFNDALTTAYEQTAQAWNNHQQWHARTSEVIQEAVASYTSIEETNAQAIHDEDRL